MILICPSPLPFNFRKGYFKPDCLHTLSTLTSGLSSTKTITVRSTLCQKHCVRSLLTPWRLESARSSLWFSTRGWSFEDHESSVQCRFEDMKIKISLSNSHVPARDTVIPIIMARDLHAAFCQIPESSVSAKDCTSKFAINLYFLTMETGTV